MHLRSHALDSSKSYQYRIGINNFRNAADNLCYDDDEVKPDKIRFTEIISHSRDSRRHSIDVSAERMFTTPPREKERARDGSRGIKRERENGNESEEETERGKERRGIDINTRGCEKCQLGYP